MREINVDKMLARIGNTQFNEWVAFYLMEEEDDAAARKKSAQASQTSPNKQTSTFSF